MDGIVRQADVRDVEVDELGAVVLALSEGDRQADLPIGVVEPSVTPEKGLVGWSCSYGTWRLSNVSTDRTLSPAPPSMRVLVTCTLLMTGEHSIGRAPAVAAHLS